jgi:hypothetical protein
MSERYEWATAADCGLSIRGEGTRIGESEVDEGNIAVVLGDPWGTAFVVEGSDEELRSLANDILKGLDNFHSE